MKAVVHTADTLSPMGMPHQAKAAADRLVVASGLPATVVRATQFHSLAALFARIGMVGRVPTPSSGARPSSSGWPASRSSCAVAEPLDSPERRSADSRHPGATMGG